MLRTIVAIMVLTSLLVSEAQSAVLAGVQGAVSIVHGEITIRAAEGASLAPGDSVRTAEGTARIVYENGCAVKVGPRQAVSVANAPPSCDAALFWPGPAFLDDITFEDIAVATAVVIIILVVTLSPRNPSR